MFCVNCGKEVDENAVICVNCGCAIKNEGIKAERNEQKPKEKNDIINLIAVSSFLVWTLFRILGNLLQISGMAWFISSLIPFGGMVTAFIFLCMKDIKNAINKYSHVIMFFAYTFYEIVVYLDLVIY